MDLKDHPLVFAMARPEPTRPPAFGAAAIALVFGMGAAGLCGCSATRAAFGPLQYDKTSPAAPAIAATDVSKQAYPSMLQVPPQPDDVRPISAWNRNIFDMLAARRQMDAFEVAFPQTFYGAEAFAQQAKIDATPPVPPEDAKAQGDKAAAAAKQARERATPPSPAP
jgi:hypothetical protein